MVGKNQGLSSMERRRQEKNAERWEHILSSFLMSLHLKITLNYACLVRTIHSMLNTYFGDRTEFKNNNQIFSWRGQNKNKKRSRYREPNKLFLEIFFCRKCCYAVEHSPGIFI